MGTVKGDGADYDNGDGEEKKEGGDQKVALEGWR